MLAHLSHVMTLEINDKIEFEHFSRQVLYTAF